jgi:hypothetical protein
MRDHRLAPAARETRSYSIKRAESAASYETAGPIYDTSTPHRAGRQAQSILKGRHQEDLMSRGVQVDGHNKRSLEILAFGIGAVIAVAVVTGLVMYQPASVEPPAPALAMVSEPVRVQPAASPEPPPPPVKFANPFDRSEVFEFPAGTSKAEARRKVAELLLERAQERAQKTRRVATLHGTRTAAR